MKQFFESNPGLKSRFNNFIEFDDYNARELMDILISMSQAEDYVISDKAQELLSKQFIRTFESKGNEFANGRFVRNIFESMMMNHARRVVQLESPTLQQLKEFSEDDIPMNL